MRNKIVGFDRLPVVMGESNKLAVLAARKVVAGDVDDSLNPLVLVGPSGCGKTRLLATIAEGVACCQDGRLLVSITSRKLLEEYVAALSNAIIEIFRQKFANADILILDDFEFLAGRKNLQDEVFAIVDSILQNGKQIVIATSASLKDLSGQICDKLIGRISSGAMVEIVYPDETMKRQYLQFAMSSKGLELPEATIEVAVKSDGKSFWDLKGIVGRAVIMADANATNVEKECNQKEVSNGRNSEDTKAVLEVLKQNGVKAKVLHEFAKTHIKGIVLNLEHGIRYCQLADQAEAIAKVLGIDVTALRIEAPIPGSDLACIQYPNSDYDPFAISPDDPDQNIVYRERKTVEWVPQLPIIAGKRVDGNIESFDLTSMPHLLVGGSCDKEGVERFIDATMAGWVSSRTPDQVQFILVDSNDHAFAKYAGDPHLVVPPLEDGRRIAFATDWLVKEMERRLKIFARAKVRNIADFNSDPTHAKPDIFGDFPDYEYDLPATVPYIVMVIGDYVCLKGVEEAVLCDIAKIAAKGRSAGIHLVIATSEVGTEALVEILHFIPGRIAFKAASPEESRMLIDDEGAENLLGGGDCLYRGKDGALIRLQAPTCISDCAKGIKK